MPLYTVFCTATFLRKPQTPASVTRPLSCKISRAHHPRNLALPQSIHPLNVITSCSHKIFLDDNSPVLFASVLLGRPC